MLWEIGGTFNGTRADDVMAFTAADSGPYAIVGLGGNHIIIDSSRKLVLPGDYGRNTHILGGPGNDWMDGENGDDQLAGGTGNDTLYGGPGVNHLIGGEGDDLLDASIGAWHGFFWHTDIAAGGPAVRAESERSLGDTLDGGEDMDTLIGSWGDDLLDGGHRVG